MKGLRINLFIIILSSISSVAYSQIPSVVKADARNLLTNGDVYGAIGKYEEYYILKPEDSDAIITLSELLELTRDYEKSASYYYKAYELDKNENIICLYNAAKMLKMTGAYDTALKDFMTFKQMYKGSDSDRDIKKLVDEQIKGCIMSDSLHNSPIKVKLAHLDTSVNKVYSEFSPFPVNDTLLIYASLRSDEYIKSGENHEIKRFYSAKKIDGEWKGGFEFNELFNDSRDISGNGVFSEDKCRFYFTRCQKDLKDKVNCSLYQSTKIGQNWDKPQKLNSEINLKRFNSTQPAVATDQNAKSKETVYFASDRPEGRGGYDIWYFTYDNLKKEFSEVKNAGNTINSPGNEITPFYSNDKMTLFFSSDGHPGLGGLDIFQTIGTKRKWSEPVNVGFPLNTNSDDLYFSLIPEKNEGFFVSNRTGSISYSNYNCCDDIYTFQWLDYASLSIFGGINIFDKQDVELEPVSNSYDFISDENINKIISTIDPDNKIFNKFKNRMDSIRLVRDLVEVDIMLYAGDFDTIKNDLISKLKSENKSLKSVDLENYLQERKKYLESIDPVTSDYLYDIANKLLQISGNKIEDLSEHERLLLTGELVSTDIFIKNNDVILLHDSYLRIKNILPELTQEDWKVYIESRTNELNKSKDVLASDLSKGSDGEKPDFKRTFISLYYIDPLSGEQILIRKDSVWPDGLFKLEAIPGNDYKLVAEAPGFLRKSYDFSTRNTQWSDTLNLDIQLVPINDKPIVLENIYFDFDKSDLRPEVKLCLDTTLIKVLIDNPEISIEFSAHTDSKGSPSYNLKLSQARAESVVNYIKEKGISPERVVAKGYGETMPVAPNTNDDGSDNPEGRKKNRRVEFKIIKVNEIIEK